MKNVLITGAAGFLGSNLSKKYLDDGWKVCGVDDFSTSMGRNSPHVLDLKKSSNFTLLDCNIAENLNVITLFLMQHNVKLDLILNFACPASPPKYQALAFHTLDTCYQGTKNMLALAHNFKCPIVHASTSEIYGDPEISPQHENYKGCVNTWGDRANYDEGKRVAETLCYEYLKKLGVDVRVVRIFNTYGPNMDPDDGRVVTNFVKQALNNEDITIYGNGEQTRSFCYVDDLIQAIMKMGSLNLNPKSPINIGNPNEISVFELATKIIELTNSTSKIIHHNLPQDDPKQRNPNIDKAKEVLQWEPTINLTEGLLKMISYMKNL